MGRRGQHQSREPGPLQQQQTPWRAPRRRLPRHKNHLADSLPESRPFPAMVWNWNVARVKINGESCMALLDNSAQVNTIMLKYVSNHSLQVGPITDLLGSKVTCVGLGNAYTRPLGYVVIQVQVDGVQGYNENQIALVIPDLSNFSAWVPVILGTPTIGWVVNIMKEAENGCLGNALGECQGSTSIST